MILIADSGSTKTDWRLIDKDKNIHQFQTQGMNPYFQSTESISEILRKELLTLFSAFTFDGHSRIYFYGAGCGNDEKKEIIKYAVEKVFPFSQIEINTDMLGAARALCGSTPGIAAILGTGANTCYYDGKIIAEQGTSLGYVLGDEGSGAHIGKTYIMAYLNNELPNDLSARFNERFQLSKDDILDAVYRKPLPNRFLASFSKYVYQDLKEQVMIDLVASCFTQFFDKHICKYPNYKEVKLSCSGSVAFYFSNILRAVALDKNINIETIVETPIAGLTLYHLEN